MEQLLLILLMLLLIHGLLSIHCDAVACHDPRSQVPSPDHKTRVPVPEPEWSGATGQWPLTSENPLGNFGGRGAGP